LDLYYNFHYQTAHEGSETNVWLLPQFNLEAVAETTLLVLFDETPVLYAERVASGPWEQLM
jgi:hypothetical protein